jgi:hypothetical protein
MGTASNWISNFVVVQVTPLGIQNLGWKFYLVWMTLNIAIVPTVYFFYPETANRHLEDIDRMYREQDGGMVVVAFNKEATSTKRPQRYEDGDFARADELRKSSAGKMGGKTREERVEVEHEENA